MHSNSDYHFNLFQPLTEYGRKIRNLILIMLTIWAVCVFGFQILLRIVEKPVPEASLTRFEAAHGSILSGGTDPVLYRELLHSQILAAGKVGLKPSDREVLAGGINVALRMLIPDSVLGPILAGVPELNSLKEKLVQAPDEEYLELKTGISRLQSDLMGSIAPYTGFSPGSLESVILVSCLKTEAPGGLFSTELESLPEVMKLLLTHNQSFLTDFKFLGFPFHYFYTAVFLLILFVGLCLLYNLRLDRRMRIEKIEE